MALWDLKFTPSLGALRAYAQRHGLGSLGASRQDSPRARMQALLQAREETVARARGRVQKAVSMRDVDRVIRLFGGDPTSGSKASAFAEEVLARAVKSAEKKGYASVTEYLDAMEAAKPGESGKVRPEQVAKREKTISNTKVRAYATIQRAERPITDLVDETYSSWRSYQERLFQTSFQSAKLREFARFVDSGNNAVGTIEASIAAADMLQFIVGGFEALNTLWAEFAQGKLNTSDEVRVRFLELAGDYRVRLVSPSFALWSSMRIADLFEGAATLADLRAGAVEFAKTKKVDSANYRTFMEGQEKISAQVALNVPSLQFGSAQEALNRLSDWIFTVAWTHTRLLVAGAPEVSKKIRDMARMQSAIDDQAGLSLMGDVVTSLWAVQPAAFGRRQLQVPAASLLRRTHGGLWEVFKQIHDVSIEKWPDDTHMEPNAAFDAQAGRLQRAFVQQVNFLAKRRKGQDWTPNVSRMATPEVFESARSELEDTDAERVQTERVDRWLESMQGKLELSVKRKELSLSTICHAAEELRQVASGEKRNQREQQQLLIALNGYLANIQENIGDKRTLALAKATARMGTYDLARGKIFGVFGDAASMLWQLWSTQTSSIYQKVSSTSEAFRFFQLAQRRRRDGVTGFRKSWGDRQMQASPLRVQRSVTLPSGATQNLWNWNDGASGRIAWAEIEKCARANDRLDISESKGQRARNFVELSATIDLQDEAHNFIYNYYLGRALREHFGDAGISRTVVVTELFFRHPTWRSLVSAEELKPLSAELRFETARALVAEDAKLPTNERLKLELPAAWEAAQAEVDPQIKENMERRAVTSYEQTAGQRRLFINSLALQINIAVASYDAFGMLPFELMLGALKAPAADPMQELMRKPDGSMRTGDELKTFLKDTITKLNAVNEAFQAYKTALQRQQGELEQRESPLADLLKDFTLPAFVKTQEQYEAHFLKQLESAKEIYAYIEDAEKK